MSADAHIVCFVPRESWTFSADTVVHVYPPGHSGRPILRDFINNVREKLIEGGFIDRRVLEKDMTALERHISDPETLVTSHLFFRLCGQIPR